MRELTKSIFVSACALALLVGTTTLGAATTINLDFEEGLGHGLGPVGKVDAFEIYFSNATYSLRSTPNLQFGSVNIAPYIPKSGTGGPYKPIVVDLGFDADSVSITVITSLGAITNTLTAYGAAGELIDLDSYIGDATSNHILSVSGPKIRQVVMDGQIWIDPGNGFFSHFDNMSLSVAPVPLPPSLVLQLTGLGLLGLAGWRKRRKIAA